MTPQLKAKWPFFSHLKLGAQFYLVEVDLNKYISQKTYKQFETILNQRESTRELIQMEEDYYHKVVENEIPVDQSISLMKFQYSQESFSQIQEEPQKEEVEQTIKIEENLEKKRNNYLNYLLEGGTLEEIKKKKEEEEKKEKNKFVFNDEEFPDLSSQTDKKIEDLILNSKCKIDENSNLTENTNHNKKGKKNNKKKKYTEFNIDIEVS